MQQYDSDKSGNLKAEELSNLISHYAAGSGTPVAQTDEEVSIDSIDGMGRRYQFKFDHAKHVPHPFG